MTKQTHIPRCPLSMLYNCSSQTKFQFISYTVIMIIVIAWKDFVQVSWKVWVWKILSGKEHGQVQDKLLWHRTIQLWEGQGDQSGDWARWNQRFDIMIKFKVHQNQHSYIRWCPSWVLLWCRLCVLSHQAEHSPPRRLEQKWRRTVGRVGSWILQDNSVQGWIR